jgi:hypothetical protein
MRVTTRQLLEQIVSESPQELVRRFPIRNDKWHFDNATGKFIAERSELGISMLDPWSRPIPTDALHPQRDQEGEVWGWLGSTTIEGEMVSLTIFND